MTRIASFTEYALLNRWALDWLAPTDFEKVPIEAKSDSVFKSIRKTSKNLFVSKPDTSYWHKLDTWFLLTPLKATYNGLVTLFVSRVGAAFNGAATVYTYTQYTFASTKEDKQAAWEKTCCYAFACFADTVSAACGSFAAHVARGIAADLWIAKKSHLVVLSIGGLAGLAWLSVLQRPYWASQFFASLQDRVGMYTSLTLRKQLGVVNEKGGLLPFSKRDHLEYKEEKQGNTTSVTFSGKNVDTLFEAAVLAECELIETVQKCNGFLPKDRKIQYRYPLNGNGIATELLAAERKQKQPAVRSSNALGPSSHARYLECVPELRSAQRKVDLLSTLLDSVRKLSYDDSWIVWIIKEGVNSKSSGSKIPTRDLKIEKRDSLLDSNFYKSYFKEQANKASSLGRFSWESVNVHSLDPSTQERPDTGTLLEKFEYDIRVNKWYAQGMQPGLCKDGRALLELSRETPFADYRKKKQQYWIALHPDKNLGKDTTEIFKCFQALTEQLDKEYAKGGST